MALSTTITPAKIAVAMGRAAPKPAQVEQWQMWIDDALMLISRRASKVNVEEELIDQAALDYVVREAVVSQVRRPEDATQVIVSVDDASSTKTYKSSRGRVEILDEWWDMLGLARTTEGAFSVTPTPRGGAHSPFCNLHFRGTYCSCGADLTSYRHPLYEGGVLEP